jgi:hypothetical protein
MTSDLVPYLAAVCALVALAVGVLLGFRPPAPARSDRRAAWPGLGVLLAGLGLLTAVVAYFVVLDGLDLDEPSRALVALAFAIVPAAVALALAVGPRSHSPVLVGGYVVAVVSTMIVAAISFDAGPLLAAGIDIDFQARAVVFPLAAAGVAAVGAAIGAWTYGSARPARVTALVVTVIGVLVAARTAFDGLPGVERWWAFPLAVLLGFAATWTAELVTTDQQVVRQLLPVVAVAVAFVVGYVLTTDAVPLDESNRYGLGLVAVGVVSADRLGSRPALWASTAAALVALAVAVDLALA